jgi:hypothetical protein
VPVQKEPVKPKSRRAVDRRDETYPWPLLADCILILAYIFSNGWSFKLEIQLYFVLAAAVIFVVTMLAAAALFFFAQRLVYYAGSEA